MWSKSKFVNRKFLMQDLYQQHQLQKNTGNVIKTKTLDFGFGWGVELELGLALEPWFRLETGLELG